MTHFVIPENTPATKASIFRLYYLISVANIGHSLKVIIADIMIAWIYPLLSEDVSIFQTSLSKQSVRLLIAPILFYSYALMTPLITRSTSSQSSVGTRVISTPK